jgi:hypothetical protein
MNLEFANSLVPQEIKVITELHDVIVPAACSNHFGIHFRVGDSEEPRREHRYTVTHLKTGLAIHRLLCSIETIGKAVQYIEMLEEISDWDFSVSEFFSSSVRKRDSLKDKVERVINAAA